MSEQSAASQRRVLEGSADHIIVLHDATWADFQRLLEIRGERPVPRLTYLEGAVELRRPSHPHELLRSIIGRLIETWCLEKAVAITPYGSWLLESKADERGIDLSLLLQFVEVGAGDARRHRVPRRAVASGLTRSTNNGKM